MREEHVGAKQRSRCGRCRAQENALWRRSFARRSNSPLFFLAFFYRDFQRGKVSIPPPALLQLVRCYSQAFLTAFHGFLQFFFYPHLPTTRNILNNVVYLISFNSGGSLRNVFDSRPEGAGSGCRDHLKFFFTKYGESVRRRKRDDNSENGRKKKFIPSKGLLQ